MKESNEEQHESDVLLHEKRDSITLKRNAKGEYAWDIKLYFDAESDRRAAHILADIADIDMSLRKGYL